MQQHLVIAGGGQAAAQAAQSARQLGYAGRISLVAAEPYLPYQRPPLSKKYLAGEVTADRLVLKPEEFYRARSIELMTGVRVEACDAAGRTLRLSDGSALEFTELVIATGATPRRLEIPGVELEGVHYFRSIDDVEAIRADFVAGKQLLVVGAGYIGLEVAAVAASAGLNVTVIEAGERALARSVSPEVSAFFTGYHAERGVEFRFGSAITAFRGERRVRYAETSEGERVDCELVVIGIGIEPDTSLAATAKLECNNGILVDAGCRSSVAGIFAAGDCANHAHPWVGARVRLESVQNAIEQGKAAAASIVGRDEPFTAVPWFWSDQYDLKLQIAGVSRGYDRAVMRGEPATGSFAVFYLAREQLIAVDCINDPRTFILAKQRLPDRPRWPAAAIADTGTDLAELQDASR